MFKCYILSMIMISLPLAPVVQDEPILSLSLHSQRQTLVSYEPLPVTLTLTNEGPRPVSGEFYLDLWIGQLKIFYRKVNSPFSQYHCLRTEYAEKRNFIHLSKVTLVPAGQRIHSETVLFDNKTRRFLFAEPGEYEFKAVFQYVLSDPAKTVESNTMRVTVVGMREEESEALAAWRDEEVAEIVQGDADFPGAVENPRALNKAKEFIEKYSNSVYAPHARSGLLQHLEMKAKRGKLTDAERRLYQSFRR